jgi:elongation factor Ts
MAKFTVDDVKRLREETGAGMLDCKKALDAAEGDFEQAREIVRAQGLAKAEKKAGRETGEGYLAAYVHATNKVAALVEVLCETDFVARNEELQAMTKDVAMQVAAMKPADVDELMDQEFIKDPSTTIGEMVKGLSGRIGEKIIISRFVRYEVGEE